MTVVSQGLPQYGEAFEAPPRQGQARLLDATIEAE